MRFKFAAQIGKVIEFTIEDQHRAAIGGDHRLASGGRQVEDRQPPESQLQLALRVGPIALIVRAALYHQGGHHLNRAGGFLPACRPVRREITTDTTHIA